MDEVGDLLTITRDGTEDARIVRLRFAGEIDAANVHLVESAFASTVDEVGGRLEIDLSGVDFMDSSGLNALVVVRNTLDDRGVKLVISDVSDQVRRLFELSGLMTAFVFAR
jgi:anti-sigma B factor antagonist